MGSSRRRPSRLVLGTVAAVLAIVLVIGVWAVPNAGTALVVRKPVADPDAIVSLASHEWERLPATAMLAGRFPHAIVVLTQPNPVSVFNCHDCANRVHRLTRAGVAAERIRIVPLVEGGTYGEALAVRRLATTTAFNRVLVVTSPYHTRRSIATFETVLNPVGIEVGIEPATTWSPAVPARWWASAYDRAYVRYEWAGLVYYAIRRRLR